MKARRIAGAGELDALVDGVVLVRDVRDTEGRIAFAKGHALRDGDRARLATLPWGELHVLEPEPGDVHELAAGARVAAAAAGEGTRVGTLSAGHWPIEAAHRGLVDVDVASLTAVNAPGELAVYTLLEGQVVDAGETVARVKVVPFVVSGATVSAAESTLGAARGVVRVRAFGAGRIGAVVQESLGSGALARFERALGEKVSWFGSALLPPAFVPPDREAVAAALRDMVRGGATAIVVAGSSAMDPLEPAFAALGAVGARIERVGVPAHPGSLLWIAFVGEIPVIGMPSCGLFSRATVFDLVLPRLLAGARVDAAWLASLGHGGLLTRDMASRFPPYRTSRDRGEVD